LAMPTAHRLLGELAAWGALTRRDDGAYVIGRRLWQIGLLAPSSSTLREAAAPFLHDLHAATRATVHLGIREDLSVLYLERLAGSVSVPVISRVGSRLPLHATGVGKVLLAYAPAEIRAAALARLDRITPYTITQPRLLQRQLVRVLEEGYAQTQEEMSLGACSVAVPVRDHDQQVIAALGIVVPSLARHRARLVAALRVAAAGVERTLGPPP
jgi:DNA-binding IclR family transcriptional regulator